MVSTLFLTRLGSWLLFAALSLGAILVQTLPLSVGNGHWPGPDMVMVLAFVWVLRRPDLLPAWLVIGLGLLTDFTLMRPLGLGATVLLLATEFLRGRGHAAKEWPFALEWAVVVSVMVIAMLATRLVMGIASADQATLGLGIQQIVSNAIAYPLALFVSVRFLGIRRLKSTEAIAG